MEELKLAPSSIKSCQIDVAVKGRMADTCSEPLYITVDITIFLVS